MSDNVYFGFGFGLILFLIGMAIGLNCAEDNAHEVRKEAVCGAPYGSL